MNVSDAAKTAQLVADALDRSAHSVRAARQVAATHGPERKAAVVANLAAAEGVLHALDWSPVTAGVTDALAGYRATLSEVLGQAAQTDRRWHIGPVPAHWRGVGDDKPLVASLDQLERDLSGAHATAMSANVLQLVPAGSASARQVKHLHNSLIANSFHEVPGDPKLFERLTPDLADDVRTTFSARMDPAANRLTR